MNLTVSYSERSVGGFSGVKHHFVNFHVEFSKQEQAIIQERGLYDHFIEVPIDTPPPTAGGDFMAMVMRIVGIVLVPVGIFLSATSSNGSPGGLMLIAGIVLFIVGKNKDRKAFKREATDSQKLTLRRLLSNPDFSSFASNLQDGKNTEAVVRETLSEMMNSIRENTSTPKEVTYEL